MCCFWLGDWYRQVLPSHHGQRAAGSGSFMGKHWEKMRSWKGDPRQDHWENELAAAAEGRRMQHWEVGPPLHSLSSCKASTSTCHLAGSKAPVAFLPQQPIASQWIQSWLVGLADVCGAGVWSVWYWPKREKCKTYNCIHIYSYTEPLPEYKISLQCRLYDKCVFFFKKVVFSWTMWFMPYWYQPFWASHGCGIKG